jgi:TatD DNase family protein
MLIDSHCHLDFYEGAELDAVMERAARAGVAFMLTIGTRLGQFDRVRAIAERFPSVFCTVGVHPHEAANEPDLAVDRLIELAQHPKVVGVGESGLDFHYDHSPRDRQAAAFQVHIEAAKALGLPLVVHSRNADSETAEMLEIGAADGRLNGLIHCFSTTRQLSDKALDIGFLISLSGIVTFKNAETIRDIAKDIPADRLLVETDAPYLAPVPVRGKRNEPAYLAHTAGFVAGLRGQSATELAQETTANFLRLFSKAAAIIAAR